MIIFSDIENHEIPTFQTVTTWKRFKLERSNFGFLLILPKVLSILIYSKT